MAEGSLAGERLEASVALLPAATTVVTPEATSVATALLMDSE